MQIRRLMPVECARLQGFPDDYLDIEFKGKPATDGHKYKALGNSWAVPCVRWIGARIDAEVRK
jgi:DNA (cytosine-5)-methyltransferase 1